ncbi:MAG: hypothetical protein SGJ05_02305 [bacterium]|nr:hypothetical protein [bacterium]
MLLLVAWKSPTPLTGVVFGDTEVSTMLTANKIVPASFFTNCVRTPLSIVLSSKSTIDWSMTLDAASATCSDSLASWTMTSDQRTSWNLTVPTVKTSLLNAFTTFRSYAVQRPLVVCVVTGLNGSSSGAYTSVTSSPDPTNPDRFLITLVQQPGGSSNGKE